MRQFERVFGARFGMRPKLYSRIVRFQAALDRKARSSRNSWADVAHEFGYHDQMHMVHDFEEFTGETPTETLRLSEMYSRQQLPPGVVLDHLCRVKVCVNQDHDR